MRGLFRRLAERIAEGTGLTRFLSRRRSSRCLVLAYHNIVPDHEAGRGDRSLHLPLSRFREHLDLLQARATLTGLDRVAVGETDPAAPSVVVTFDDAYRGAVTLGLPELASRSVPATIFVSTGLLGHSACWWDEAAEAGWLTSAARIEALTGDFGMADRVRATHILPNPIRLPASYGIATETELRQAALRPGVTFGAHGWTHANLTVLEPSQLREELARPRTWLADTFGDRFLDWIAYPYGLVNPTVLAAVREVGIGGGLRAAGGWWPPGAGSLLDGPRLTVPADLTAEGLGLRLAGLRHE